MHNEMKMLELLECFNQYLEDPGPMVEVIRKKMCSFQWHPRPQVLQKSVNTNPSTFFKIAVMRWQCSNGNFWRDWWYKFLLAHPSQFGGGLFPRKPQTEQKKAKFPGLLSGSAAPTLTDWKKLHDLDAENVIWTYEAWRNLHTHNIYIYVQHIYTYTYIHI